MIDAVWRERLDRWLRRGGNPIQDVAEPVNNDVSHVSELKARAERCGRERKRRRSICCASGVPQVPSPRVLRMLPVALCHDFVTGPP